MENLTWVGLGLLALLMGEVECARILAVLPFPGKSHFIYHRALFGALAARGHHIVEYSPFPPEDTRTLPNYTHHEIHSSYEEVLKIITYDDFLHIISGDQPGLGVGFQGIWDMTYNICLDTLQNAKIQKLLKSKEHFDLVITESTFGQESMVVFGHRFKAPTVTFQAFSLWSVINRVAGNAIPVSSIPEIVAVIASDQMSFMERFINVISTCLTLYSYYNHHIPAHERIIHEHYKGEGKTPSLVDMVGNVSLYLVNTHPAVEYPQPYSPNIIPVGGVTISPDRTPLPPNIKNFMDGAKEGVIYFSLGTVVPAHVIPKEKLEIFVNVFNKMKQRVLWKIDLKNIEGLSQNVLLTKWVPQPGVLGHTNCILFITHGGLLSQLEAINAGVPTVAMPFFGDQAFNVRFSEHRGIGVKLDFSSITEQSLEASLNTVLNTPKYRERAQRLAHIFRDRAASPADSAVFWVEYVARHGGAPHLRPAASRLPWYQLALIDVLAAVVTVIVLVALCLYLIIKKGLNVILGNNKTKSLSGSKKIN